MYIFTGIYNGALHVAYLIANMQLTQAIFMNELNNFLYSA